MTSENISVIRVYYPTLDTKLYQKDVLYEWYELVSEYNFFFSQTFL